MVYPQQLPEPRPRVLSLKTGVQLEVVNVSIQLPGSLLKTDNILSDLHNYNVLDA